MKDVYRGEARVDSLDFGQRRLGCASRRAKARVLAAKWGWVFGAVAAKEHGQQGARATHKQETASRERGPPLAGTQEVSDFFTKPNFAFPPQRRAHALWGFSRAVHGGLGPPLAFAHRVALEALVEQQGVALEDAPCEAAASER